MTVKGKEMGDLTKKISDAIVGAVQTVRDELYNGTTPTRSQMVEFMMATYSACGMFTARTETMLIPMGLRPEEVATLKKLTEAIGNTEGMRLTNEAREEADAIEKN